MNRIWWSASILLGVVLLSLSCGETYSPRAEVRTPTIKTPAAGPQAVWEQRWETTLAAARKEGSVSIYSLWTVEVRSALSKAFKEKYGIDLEFSLFSRADELAAKVQAEQRAGLHIADVFTPGNAAVILNMKPYGLLGPVEPLLILPEVLESKLWVGGKIPFLDKGGTSLMMIGGVQRNVVINTGLIKEGEITNFKDLLKPQYKGKIVINDPSLTGATNATVTHLALNLWGEEETVDFLKRLIKEQETVRDLRLQIESVARGKRAVGFAPRQATVPEFIAMGAPIKFVPGLKEDNHLTPSTGTLSVASTLAHPNATTVFVNWLLTKEGQSILATSWGFPSTRLDASTQGIDPLLIPESGEKYFIDTEEEMGVRARWLEIGRRIIAETTR